MLSQQTPKIVILTGAGISAESGIQTFRASDGLWEEHRVEDVATPEAFARNPKLVQDFYNQRRKNLLSSDIKPNQAHFAIAKLEQQLGVGSVLVITQNIDNLHERAGSKNIIHMHGELLKARCCDCGNVVEQYEDLDDRSLCPLCHAQLRPHIVWFGEMPLDMEEIYHALQYCELFVSIGTSGNVYPAAGFVQEATHWGANTLELNLERSKGTTIFKESRFGKATVLVPAFVEEILIAKNFKP